MAPLICNYKNDRVLTKWYAVQVPFNSIKEARDSLSWIGSIEDIEAILLSLKNEDYVPVYKVTPLNSNSTSSLAPS